MNLFAACLAALILMLTRVPLVVENGVLFVRASLNGTGPMLFVFDPGSGDLITTYARRQLHGNAAHELRLGGVSLSASFQTLPGDPQQLVPSHGIRLGQIAGSIGPALLQRYAVTIDYAHKSLALTGTENVHALKRARSFPLHLDVSGLPLIPARVDGVAGAFEVDVRAPNGLLFSPFARRNGFLTRYEAQPLLKRSAIGPQYAVRRVTVAGETLHAVPTWFSTAVEGKFAANDAAGSLGNNVLSHFLVIFDYRDRSILLVAQRG